MTKKSKIDPKKRKNGDNFFKMSSIIIIKNIKLIDFFPVFLTTFHDSGCWNMFRFLQASMSK